MTNYQIIGTGFLILAILISLFILIMASLSDRELDKLIKIEEDKNRSVITFNAEVDRLLEF